jgi:hypothetical protein
MTTYDSLRAKVEQLGGSAGPDGVGSINLTGGTEIQFEYNPPGPGTRVVSVVPYLIGSDKLSNQSPPPPGHQTLLAWQYKPAPPPAPQAPPGWRCFKIQQIKDNSISAGAQPRPANLPTLDPDRQNSVRTF